MAKLLALTAPVGGGIGGIGMGGGGGMDTDINAKGRRAAHKNAFVLISKGQFVTAAAVFLCAVPPYVKEYVESKES